MADDESQTSGNSEPRGDPEPAENSDTSGNPRAATDQPEADKKETGFRRLLPRRQRVGALVYPAVLLLAVFGLGMVLGIFVIGGSATGSPNDSYACSYFSQFQAAPDMPGLVQAALSHDPGAGPGSHYLYEWLYTLEQQVSIPHVTLAELQADSTDPTAMGISAICQQLGFISPTS